MLLLPSDSEQKCLTGSTIQNYTFVFQGSKLDLTVKPFFNKHQINAAGSTKHELTFHASNVSIGYQTSILRTRVQSEKYNVEKGGARLGYANKP